MKTKTLITPIIVISLFALVSILAYYSAGNLFWIVQK